MQLAPSIASMKPSGVHASNHVVSPSRLFAIADTRFKAALGVLGSGRSLLAPSALTTSIALREATSGIGTLNSVLVPGTPWGSRQVAASAMIHANEALGQLQQYLVAMAPRGEGPFQRGELAPGTLVLLDAARSALRRATRVLP